MTSRACPFKGLASFQDSDDDARLFFGREREREIIVANLLASRLTVLYGDTGVGKSSVLRAGVARELRTLPDALAVVVFDEWRDDPARALEVRIATATGAEPQGGIADTLELGAALVGGEVVVILDGIEEEFLYHGTEAGPGSFLDEFSEAATRPGLRASFLLAIREDALAKLDRFKSRIPNVFGNYLRLEHLDRASGRDAIVRPVGRYNELAVDGAVEIEPALVEAVLDQVAAGKVELGQAGRGGVGEDGSQGVEAPFLQLVMARLWYAEADAGSTVLRLETFVRLGGAEQIVRDHLERALASLDDDQQDVAAAVFNHLVTPSGTKVAHDAADLAGYVGTATDEVEPVLSLLAAERILRPVPGVRGSEFPRYEIYHDILAEAVLAWRTRHESAREVERVREAEAKRHRRLLVIAIAAVVLAAAMAGVTIFAFSQRSEADTQARKAHARALDASALSLLSIDPELSLALGVEAAKRDRGGQAEDVTRRALLASRVRAVLPADGPVVAARYFPNGLSFLVAGGSRVRVYDSRSPGRKPRMTFDHGAPITAVDVSPSGRVVATAGADGKVRLWSARSGRLLRVLRNGAAVRSIRFDRRGSRLVAAGGRAVRAWLVADGSPLFVHRFDWPVTGAIFSRDIRGRQIAIWGNNSSAALFNVASGKPVRTFVQGSSVKDAAFSPDGKLLATGGQNHSAVIWDALTGKPLYTLPHQGEVVAVAFSPDGMLLATASTDGYGRVWEVATGKLVAPLIGHSHYVVAIAFSDDGKYVVTSSTDGTARVWQAQGEFWALLTGDSDAVTQASFSPDGRRVLTASDDGSARLWDPRIRPQMLVLASEQGPLARISLLPGGLILTAGPRREALLLRASDGHVVRAFRVRADVSAAAASADMKLLALAAGRNVTLFDLASGKRLRMLSQPSVVAGLAFSPAGDELATGGSDGVARIWSSTKQEVPRALEGHTKAITDLTFSPDGRLIATASKDATARIWDVASGRSLHRLAEDTNDVTSVAFSADGSALLTASKDADAKIWSVETGKREQLLRWHFGAVTDAAFSPDGRWIVTTGPTTLQLWQPGVREPLFGHGIKGDSKMTGAVFNPRSRELVTATARGKLLVYRCTICGGLDRLLPLARARLALTGRTLSKADRKRFGG